MIEQLNLESSQLDIRIDTVGLNDSQATFNAVDIAEKELASFFTLRYEGEEIDRFKLPALGDYNIKHALEAIAVGYYFGLSFSEMKAALKNFKGVKRRFETIYQDQDQIVISDYAHHPSEVKAVVDNLANIKTNKDKVVIFQPHQYIRTQRLLNEYDGVLNQEIAERAIFRIYKVREQVGEEELVNLGQELSQKISENEVNYFNSYQELEGWLADYKSDTGVIYLFLGAGDIDEWVRKWAQSL
mgnify:CR=1 FL=1